MQTEITDEAAVIEIRDLSTRFGVYVVHAGVDLEVRRAELFALAGGSGSGKSTLLREMNLLQRPAPVRARYRFDGRALASRQSRSARLFRRPARPGTARTSVTTCHGAGMRTKVAGIGALD
ncbi:MAG: ATP-binding cassette domain-containing protein [Gammaproteobacteria bacterium]|nr:ATP-binding cassette domain-containing protein [Gammaproteobacteria bacterium]